MLVGSMAKLTQCFCATKERVREDVSNYAQQSLTELNYSYANNIKDLLLSGYNVPGTWTKILT